MDPDTVSQLCEVAAVGPERAEHLLRATGGNLDAAIALHFNDGVEDWPGPPPTQPLPTAQPVVQPAELPAQEETILPDWLSSSLTTIGRHTSRILAPVIGVASEDFGDFFDRKELAHPCFFEGAFAEASNEARRRGCPLAVWLQASERDDGMSLLADEGVRAVLEEFVVWGGDLGRFEPFQVARLLQVTAPALVVVTPSAGRADWSTREWPRGNFFHVLRALSAVSLDPVQCCTDLRAALDECSG
jgi:hypothetical protein